MKRHVFSSFLLCLAVTITAQTAQIQSPDGRITVKQTGKTIAVSYRNQHVVGIDVAESATGTLAFQRTVKEDYQMFTGKRLHCTNQANEYRVGRLVVRLYNDGVAFRHEGGIDENCAYVIADGTRRWLQKWVDSYEEFFPLTTKAEDGRWAYPALFEPADGVFALISEASIERGQSASCLFSQGDSYQVVQEKREEGGAVPGHTPWRVVIIGSLNDVVESTLITDVSEPSKIKDTGWIRPGVVSWVYWAYNHGSNDYNIIKKYSDMAATLKLPYVLIDAEWDEMNKVAANEGKTVEDAVSYALSKGVRPLIWYNSSVGWVNGAPGPKFRLNKPEDREREFAWCEKIGVAGVKIDFFSGDTQMNMDYCQDLLECAARHHLLVNFHGATIPRGWQRTWPNLMTTEGVYGAEWYNNVPTFTKRAARHNATLPFTRNVIGPMDYTPCTFSDSQHPHITTNAHELALTVLFESGLQHLADRPESYLSQPQQVRQFLSALPSVWDETRFLSGYPGESVTLARRSGSTWFVAGINGKDEPQTVSLPSEFLKGKTGKIDAFLDGTESWQLQTLDKLPSSVQCQPRGGFVFVVHAAPRPQILSGSPYIHDPSTIAECDGKYYTFGTGGGGLISDDGWSWHSGAVRPGGGAAPDVLKMGDRYLVIYGATGGGLGGGHNGRILTMWNKTLDPQSPDFKYTTAVEVCSSDGMEDQDAIDPSLLLDPTTGRLWVSYGTYFGTIRLIELDPTTGYRKNGNKELDIAIDCEATDLIFRDGWYYLLGTHGTCCDGVNSTYNIVVGRSRQVTGPYVDNVGRDMMHGGGRMVVAANGRGVGPGHFGRTVVDEGVELMSCHYEADLDRSGRSVLTIMPLLWKNGWPYAGQPLKGGDYSIVSERRGYSLELAVDFVRMEQQRERFWDMDTKKPLVSIPYQQLSQVVDTWPKDNIALRCGDYMMRPHQHWTITPLYDQPGFLGSPYCKITIKGTDRVLAATADKELTTLPAFTGSDEQLWRIEQLTDGTYRIMPKVIPGIEGLNTRYCIYSAGDSTPTLSEYDFNSDNSKWNLQPTE